MSNPYDLNSVYLSSLFPKKYGRDLNLSLADSEALRKIKELEQELKEIKERLDKDRYNR